MEEKEKTLTATYDELVRLYQRQAALNVVKDALKKAREASIGGWVRLSNDYVDTLIEMMEGKI